MSVWLLAVTVTVGMAAIAGVKIVNRYLHPQVAPSTWPNKLSCKKCGTAFETETDKFCDNCGEPNKPQKAKVWRISPRAGSLNNLRLGEENVAPPHDDGSVLIEIDVKAIGLNFAGLYSATPPGNFIPGLEYAGVVTHLLQSRGHKYKVGDRIMGCTRFGGFTSKLIADVRCIQTLPASWSFQHGASFLCQALTAYYGLKALGNIKKGDVVLVHSVAGGVGLFCAQIVHKLGGIVIGTIGSNKKIQYLLDSTCMKREQIIVRTTGKAFGAQLNVALKACGKEGLNIIMDSLMGDYFQPGYDRLLPTGRLVVFGAGSMTSSCDAPDWFRLAWRFLTRPILDPLSLISANKAVIGFNLIWLWEHLEELQAMVQEMIQLLQIDTSLPHIDKEFPFDQMVEALRHLHSGMSIGKVVVSVDGS